MYFNRPKQSYTSHLNQKLIMPPLASRNTQESHSDQDRSLQWQIVGNKNTDTVDSASSASGKGFAIDDINLTTGSVASIRTKFNRHEGHLFLYMDEARENYFVTR
jgi:hypothetical protein